MSKNTRHRLRVAVAMREGMSYEAFDQEVEAGGTAVLITPCYCAYCGNIGTVRWERGAAPTFTMAFREADGSYRHEPAHLDHIIPESRNGPTSLDNTVIACATCNMAKGDSAFGEPEFQMWLTKHRQKVEKRMAEFFA